MEIEAQTIALFGEAEKGEFQTAYYCQSLPQLVDYLGNPPIHSHGLFYAVQALLYHRDLLFFRVKEEGFSQQDYLIGLRLLETQQIIPHISAICLPGVGDIKIIRAMVPFCKSHHSFIITTEPDLYDYLTERNQ
jgi:hypothetical protein